MTLLNTRIVQSRYTSGTPTCGGARRARRARRPSLLSVVVRSQSGFGQGKDTGNKAGPKKASKTSKTSKRGKESSRKDPNLQLQSNIKEFEEAARAAGAASEISEPSYVDNVVDVDLDASSSDTVPEVVTNRMLKRIAIFAGSPVLVGMLLFPLFYYVKKVQGIDLPVWAVYIVQTTIFGGGLLGISYGIISTSFDERREGSFLGWNEFKANLPQVLSSFGGRK